MIRVALAITDLEVGGAERCLVNLASGLDRHRFEPVVYCLASPPPDSRQALVAQLARQRVSVEFLGGRWSWQLPGVARRLRRLIQRDQPHIVHAFLFHAAVVATLATETSGKSRLLVGIRVAEPSVWRWRVLRRLAHRIDRFIAVSQTAADYAVDVGNLPAEKTTTIANGIDIRNFPAQYGIDLTTLGVPPGRRAVVCVARLDKQKGIDWLLRLAPRLLDELCEHDLVLVGDGPQSTYLKRLARSLGIGPRVHFAGWQAEIPQLLRSCDLLVLPSRWEGMPNVLLEAMASGLPVVATECQGVAQLLGPLFKHQLVKHRDPLEFVRKCVEIARNGQLAAELGEQNRIRIREHFSLHAMIQAHQRLYEAEAGM